MPGIYEADMSSLKAAPKPHLSGKGPALVLLHCVGVDYHIQKAHVSGISLGGLIAQHFAAANPDMVDRLVLIDTTPRYVDEMRHMWGMRAKTARKQGVAALIDGLLKIWFSDAAVADNAAAVQYVRATLARCPGEGYALA